jgi:hypothetical protein
MAIKLGPGKKGPVQKGRNFVWSQKQQTSFDKTLAPGTRAKKKYKAKRVSVLEVGAGHKPRGIFAQALKALRIRKGRTFEASDIEIKATETAQIFGLSKIPKNASVLKMCSLEHLTQTKPASKDIIFGSYFLNGLIAEKSQAEGVQKLFTFFREIKRVLKPRGRCILIADVANVEDLSRLAKSFELKVYIAPVTKEQASRNTSEWLEYMMKKEGRNDFLRQRVASGDVTEERIAADVRKYGLREAQELLKPQILVVSK